MGGGGVTSGRLLPVAAALLAILTWSLAVGSSLGGVTSGRLLPIAALLTIATLLSIAARLPIGVLLRVTALIITSRLCRGIAGRRIGWRCCDWLHWVAPGYLGITVVTLSVSQVGLVVTPCARLRLTSLSRFVTILWSKRRNKKVRLFILNHKLLGKNSTNLRVTCHVRIECGNKYKCKVNDITPHVGPTVSAGREH